MGILLITIYIISVIAMWLYFRIHFSTGGKSEFLDIEDYKFMVLFIVLFPVINTVGGVILWTISYPKKTENNNNMYKLFKIKNNNNKEEDCSVCKQSMINILQFVKDNNFKKTTSPSEIYDLYVEHKNNELWK